MKVYETVADFEPLVGQELGVSDWVLVDQARINQFADATGDQQWIHVDPERAAKGPFRKTIAHGYLTLSMAASLVDSAFTIRQTRMGINYGLNKVRFPAPVFVGSRIRARFKLLSYEKLDTTPDRIGAQVVMEVTIEVEGSDKPACVAESVSRRYS